jgi:hypothetical protein
VFGLATICAGEALGSITQDAQTKSITIAAGNGDLELRLRYDGKCLLDRVVVKGQSIVPEATGICSAIKVDGHWYATRDGLPPVQVLSATEPALN